ncbi:MAG: hypothetical protein GY809_09910 [Planctomycetes bacterium]|nr:hypothetical protein [Planctomycetota bacterium]
MGYDLDLKQLCWARTWNLRPSEPGEWKKVNYSLSLKDLYELDRHNVSPDFGAALSGSALEPLTVEELSKLKQSRLSEDALKKLRRPKQP